VLGGNADKGFDTGRLAQLLHHRGHFDSLRARADNGEDAKLFHALEFLLCYIRVGEL
jgi:hypothetical protein